MSPQTENSNFGFFRYFKVAPNLFINFLKSAEGALHKLNIIKFDALDSS
jgi:hypothetical protein